ncbi:translocation/assembly module TamB [Leptolyngbya sp. FACHB-261]|uniref:translocation/assembly module TamB domain-containing protein n=1 Tax=Leptolyngbya sp. FACHB-261 TaxID=2692806 RepID=UPI001686EA0F|nr:translocation/assembly module TamB [Leptolyngbya sp. FACHB-261]MBD2103678.1 translocation/assembly module TamB domain-containing protein [Leptolyngbya sp. FACHB-261]
MTQPETEHEPEQSQQPERSYRLAKVGVGLGLGLTAGLLGLSWGARIFLTERLSPLVAESLAKTLNRPVTVGALERVSFVGMRFGPSAIPATPKDEDKATTQAVEVGFNLPRLLFTRTLDLDITLVKADIYIEQAADRQWLRPIVAPEEGQRTVTIQVQTVNIEDGQLTLVPAPLPPAPGTQVKPRAREPRVLQNVQVQTQWFNPTPEAANRRVQFQATANAVEGGRLDLRGEWDLVDKLLTLRAQGERLAAPIVNGFLPQIPVDLLNGTLNGNVGVRWYTPESPSLDGTVQVQGVTAKVARVPQLLNGVVGTLRLDGLTANFDRLQARYGQVPFQATGGIGPKGFDVKGATAPTNLDVLLRTLNVRLPFPVAGQVRSTISLTGTGQQPVLAGQFNSTNNQGRFDRIPLQRFGGRFQLVNPVVTLADFEAYPAIGGVVRGGGQVNLAQGGGLALNFQAAGVSGEQLARTYGGNLPIAVGPLSANTQVFGPATNIQIVSRWQAPSATYPARGEVAVARGVATLRNTVLNVAGGTVQADGTVTLGSQGRPGRWQGTASLRGIRLQRLTPEQRGLLNGTVGASGSLASFRPQDIRAAGNLTFSEGIAVIRQPLTTQVAWDGQQIIVRDARSERVQAQGTIGVRLQGPGSPAVGALNLNVQTNDFPLRNLAVSLPETIALVGSADFSGKLTGTPSAPRVAGALALNNLQVNNFDFADRLSGHVAYTDAGVNLDLNGGGDRIALLTDANFRPRTFEVRHGETLAVGETQGNQLLVALQQFPLGALGLRPAAQRFGAVGGDLSGDFAIDLPARGPLNPRTISLLGDVAVVRPSLGQIRAEQFTGRIRYANGNLSLENGDLRLPRRSRYQLAGRFSPGQTPQLSAQVQVVQGEIQDILQALQIFDFSDFGRIFETGRYGRANVLDNVFARGLAELSPPRETLYAQLQRFAEIQALITEQRLQARESLLPGLNELQGSFSGTLAFTGSLQQGITASFNLGGQDWRWGDLLQVQDVTAQGEFANGALTLAPLRFASGEQVGEFTGRVGGTRQAGQVRLANIPVENLENLLRLPFDATGTLSGTATLAGNLDNPQLLDGQLVLNQGQLNGTPLEQANSTFNYRDGRLSFDSTLALANSGPTVINGSIPYRLPFARVEPASNQLRLDLNVRNEGLALLNLFSRQVSWVGGEGDVNLAVRGTLAQPLATGSASFRGASFRSSLLQGSDLTDVTGNIQFDQDRVRITEPLKGRFGSGQVGALGVLPLNRALRRRDPDVDNPLTVSLTDINLSLKGLYSGRVNGVVPVTGSVFEPILNGQITLSQGQVLIPDTGSGPGLAPSGGGGGNNAAITPGFNNLRLRLGEQLQITRPPLLNFLATGDIVLNGDLQGIRPEGRVSLQRGQVNLFATRFTLDRSQENYAQFVPTQGLDPNLNVRVASAVTETTPAIANDLGGVDPTGIGLGGLRTVQVRATVTGRASQFNLALTSSPPRSEAEIVALIGGGFTETLGQGPADTALVLANFAGSALLNTVQGAVASALGLSEFRIFPTILPTEQGSSDRSLGLAMEAAVDISRRFSVSVLQVLTNSTQPTRFTLRYRVSDQILLRTFTDLGGEAGASVEFETRF